MHLAGNGAGKSGNRRSRNWQRCNVGVDDDDGSVGCDHDAFVRWGDDEDGREPGDGRGVCRWVSNNDFYGRTRGLLIETRMSRKSPAISPAFNNGRQSWLNIFFCARLILDLTNHGMFGAYRPGHDFWTQTRVGFLGRCCCCCNCVYIEKEERKQNMTEKMKSTRYKSKELYALEYGKSMYVYKYVRMKPGTFKEAAI